MPYVSRAYASKAGGFRTRTGVRRRRRTGVVARTFRRKGARAQASQIRSVARMAIKNARILQATKTYTDYEIQGRTSGDWTAGTWQVFPLMDPVMWKQTMRLNSSADNAQNAYIRNMVLQIVVGLNTMLRSTAVTLFLVSMRNQSLSYTPTNTNFVEGQNYDQCNGLMPRLNSNIFKVRWCKSFNLMSNTYSGISLTPSATDVAGDPTTTYRKITANIKIGANLRSRGVKLTPALDPTAWSDLTDEQLSASNRLYLLCYQSSGDTSNFPAAQWHALFTAITTN